jgi:hypothetical protein
MHALREIAIRVEGRYHWSPSRECIEQCLGFLEVGGIKAFGEPAINRLEQCVGLSALALALPQARQAQGGPEFEGFCLLLPGHVEGMLKTHFGVVLILTALRWMALGFA